MSPGLHIIFDLERRGITVQVDTSQGSDLVLTPKRKVTPDVVALVKANKAAVLDALKEKVWLEEDDGGTTACAADCWAEACYHGSAPDSKHMGVVWRYTHEAGCS